MNLYIAWYPPRPHLVCDVTELFCVSRQHGVLSGFLHEELILRIFTQLLAVNHEQFLMQRTQKQA